MCTYDYKIDLCTLIFIIYNLNNRPGHFVVTCYEDCMVSLAEINELGIKCPLNYLPV